MAAAAPAVYAGDADLSAEAMKCLQCHEEGSFFKFQDGDSVPVYVNSAKFKISVHNGFTCSQCHTDFAERTPPADSGAGPVPDPGVRRLPGCHTAEQIKVKPIHTNLLLRERRISSICTDCHGAHSDPRRRRENHQERNAVLHELPPARTVHALQKRGEDLLTVECPHRGERAREATVLRLPLRLLFGRASQEELPEP
jgi:hypothetical protein